MACLQPRLHARAEDADALDHARREVAGGDGTCSRGPQVGEMALVEWVEGLRAEAERGKRVIEKPSDDDSAG